MPALQVRDVPGDLYNELKVIAAKKDRSLSQQTLHILKRGVAEIKREEEYGASCFTPQVYVAPPSEEELRQQRIEKRRKLFAEIEEAHRKHDVSHVPVPGGYESVAEMIRADREERTNRIIEACGGLK